MSWIYAIGSVIIVSLVSIIGIFTLSLKEKRVRNFLMYFISFAAGGLLGDVFFHLLPESIEASGYTTLLAIIFLLGFLIFFIIEKIIHWRHCHHSHIFKTEHKEHRKHKHKIKPVAYMNLIADGTHNFLDGIIIGVSYLVSIPVGMATTLAVLLHEIPQEIGDFAILIHAGFTRNRALFFNLISALTALVGAIVAIVIGNFTQEFTSLMIIFTAGGFTYIAASDLIPELHAETRVGKSILQFLFLIAGLAVMWGLTFINI